MFQQLKGKALTTKLLLVQLSQVKPLPILNQTKEFRTKSQAKLPTPVKQFQTKTKLAKVKRMIKAKKLQVIQLLKAKALKERQKKLLAKTKLQTQMPTKVKTKKALSKRKPAQKFPWTMRQT